MKTYTFHFNTEYPSKLREAVNDRRKQSLNVQHFENEAANGLYFAWDRICAILDRLEDTLNYLNTIELGKKYVNRTAFDFYDFLNNAYIVIECIKKIGSIFRLDEEYKTTIENSNLVFGNSLCKESTDGKYFEYIRSLCSVHPLCTNHQKKFLNGDKFHCCPFVSWDARFFVNITSDLVAVVYTSRKDKGVLYIPLYVSQFENYLKEWIDIIPKIIEAKNKYTDKIYDDYRKKKIKDLSDFDNNIVQYLEYLKAEYHDRFDYDNEYIFDEYIRIFTIRLSDKRNNTLLDKYKNAILYSLSFLRKELQNMSYQGYENSGIKYPDESIETTLFDSLSSISSYDSAFSKWSYELEKIYYLEPHYYDCADKQYARDLLEYPKKCINEYIHFTNTEPDEERIVLISLALYLESLTRKSLLNKNIPNFKKYRVKKMSKEEYIKLQSYEP